MNSSFNNSENPLPLSKLREIAKARFKVLKWEDDVTAYIECPGGPHAGAGIKDTRLKLDGVPNVHCTHAKCAEALKQANRALQSECGTAQIAFAKGSSVPIRPMPRRAEVPRERLHLPLVSAPHEPTARELNSPDAFWIYRNREGQPLGATARHNKPDGTKTVLPWIWIEGKWHSKGFGDNRPLYGLELLAKRPDDPVLITEGEKAADKARELFPELVVVTWQGGTGSVKKADWSPLKGREATMWPDADEPGRKAALELAGMVEGLRIVDTSELPNKWDLADPLPDGWTMPRIEDAIKSAVSRDAVPYEKQGKLPLIECPLPERGTCPIESLAPIPRAYAEELARVYQVPVELPALCIIGVISGALGGAWEIANAVNGQTTRGNIYLALGLAPGAGKSIAGRIAKPIKEFETDRCNQWEEIGLPTIEGQYDVTSTEYKGLLSEIKNTGNGDRGAAEKHKIKLRELEKEMARSPILICQNATTSGLARELSVVDNETLFVNASEGGEVFRVMLGAYRKEGGDMELWLSGYTGDSYVQTRAPQQGSNRRTDRIQLDRPCLSALVLVQPSIMREVLGSKEARERGLLTRLLPVIIPVSPTYDDGLERTVDPKIESDWRELIHDILRVRFRGDNEPIMLRCTPEAREVFRVLFNETTDWKLGSHADLSMELSRWRENALRICVGQAVAEDLQSNVVTEETALRAVELFRWIGLGALEQFTQGRDDRLLDRAERLESMLAKSGGYKTLRLLDNHNGFSKEEVTQLVTLFPDRFRVEDRETASKPTRGVVLLSGSNH